MTTLPPSVLQHTDVFGVCRIFNLAHVTAIVYSPDKPLSTVHLYTVNGDIYKFPGEDGPKLHDAFLKYHSSL